MLPERRVPQGKAVSPIVTCASQMHLKYRKGKRGTPPSSSAASSSGDWQHPQYHQTPTQPESPTSRSEAAVSVCNQDPAQEQHQEHPTTIATRPVPRSGRLQNPVRSGPVCCRYLLVYNKKTQNLISSNSACRAHTCMAKTSAWCSISPFSLLEHF